MSSPTTDTRRSALRQALDQARTGRRDPVTVTALVDEYLAGHAAEANTLRTLAARLRYATAEFGAVRVDRLRVEELRVWRKCLPAGSAWHITKALRQVLHYAVKVGMLETNPTLLIENPEPRRREVEAFGSWDELEAVATELGTSLPIIVAGTGLRPEEWLALERRDIDRPRGIVHVRRVYVDQHLHEYGKTDGSLRAVPLCARVAEALEALPPQLHSPLLFPGPRGAYLDYKVGAAGTGHRPSGQRAFRTGPRTRSGIPSPRSRSRLESAPLRSAG